MLTLEQAKDYFAQSTQVQPDGCILWTRAKTRAGYGVLRILGQLKLAHRFAWFIEHGRWPTEGMELDHLCRVRHCVNVLHLEEVTHQENASRSPIMGARRPDPTMCGKGLHPWVPENLYRNGKHFKCKQCSLTQVKKQREARSLA